MDATDDAEELRVAAIVLADRADGRGLARHDLGDVAATLARTKLVVERRELAAEVTRDLGVAREEVQDVALRGLLSDAGKAREQRHEPSDLR